MRLGLNAALRTQKAHGLRYLATSDYAHAAVPPFEVVQTSAQVSDAFNNWTFGTPGIAPRFARPCPVTPRHGFVDSRPVRTEEEAREVFAQAQAVDPDAEMILMAFLKAKQSAILTPSAVSVGRGHDGVTGKGDDVVTFPLAHVDFSWLDKDAARVPNSPFIESVRVDQDKIYMVQLRDGPAVACNGSSYIPRDTVVASVVPAEGDLLEWEERMRKAALGTVVHMPGGSMLSHYAVHAVLNNHPVVFGQDAPKVGATLKANVSKVKPDYRALAQGIAHAVNAPHNEDEYTAPTECARLMYFAVPMIHQAMNLVQTSDGCMALGLSVGYLMKCAAGAALGEARHCGHYIKGCANREAYYAVALNAYARYREALVLAHQKFEEGNFFQGYGGKRWAGISGATIRLDKCALAFVRTPNARTYKPLLAQVHNLLNAIHNGASWMTKFVSTGFMDAAARGDVKNVLRAAYLGHDIIGGARCAPIAAWGNALPDVVCSVWDSKVEGEYRLEFEPTNWSGGVKVFAMFGTKAKHGMYLHEAYAYDLDALKRSGLAREVKSWHPSRRRTTYAVGADSVCRLPQAFIYSLANARNALIAGHPDRINNFDGQE